MAEKEDNSEPSTSKPSTSSSASAPIPSTSKAPGNLTRIQRNVAEKQRRDKLNGYISELASIVPMVSMSSKRLDKTSILRLSAAHLRLCKSPLSGNRKLKKSFKWCPSFLTNDQIREILESVDGFLIVTTSSGKVLFTSRSVERYLGHQDIDIIGHSLFVFVHPEDVDAVKSEIDTLLTTSLKKRGTGPTPRCSFRCRMKEKGQPRSEVVTYQCVHLSGDITFFEDEKPKAGKSSSIISHIFKAFVKVVDENPYNQLSLDEATADEYVTRHSLDGTIIFADHRLSTITGHLPQEVIGFSAYHYILSDDISVALFAHHLMFSNDKGTGMVVYRLRTRDDKYVYLKSVGCLQFDRATSQVDHFVCVNQHLSEAEGEVQLKYFVDRFIPHIKESSTLSLFESVKAPRLSALKSQTTSSNLVGHIAGKNPLPPFLTPGSGQTSGAMNNEHSSHSSVNKSVSASVSSASVGSQAQDLGSDSNSKVAEAPEALKLTSLKNPFSKTVNVLPQSPSVSFPFHTQTKEPTESENMHVINDKDQDTISNISTGIQTDGVISTNISTSKASHLITSIASDTNNQTNCLSNGVQSSSVFQTSHSADGNNLRPLGHAKDRKCGKTSIKQQVSKDVTDCQTIESAQIVSGHSVSTKADRSAYNELEYHIKLDRTSVASDGDIGMKQHSKKLTFEDVNHTDFHGLDSYSLTDSGSVICANDLPISISEVLQKNPNEQMTLFCTSFADNSAIYTSGNFDTPIPNDSNAASLDTTWSSRNNSELKQSTTLSSENAVSSMDCSDNVLNMCTMQENEFKDGAPLQDISSLLDSTLPLDYSSLPVADGWNEFLGTEDLLSSTNLDIALNNSDGEQLLNVCDDKPFNMW